ncbi:unnamed protein product [Arctogadus glacialis]
MDTKAMVLAAASMLMEEFTEECLQVVDLVESLLQTTIGLWNTCSSTNTFQPRAVVQTRCITLGVVYSACQPTR